METAEERQHELRGEMLKVEVRRQERKQTGIAYLRSVIYLYYVRMHICAVVCVSALAMSTKDNGISDVPIKLKTKCTCIAVGSHKASTSEQDSLCELLIGRLNSDCLSGVYQALFLCSVVLLFMQILSKHTALSKSAYESGF